LFHKAIESDQTFASAYGMAAWCYVSRKINRWMVDLPQEIAEGSRLARQALELANDDAVALTRGGHALAHLTGDIEAGVGPVDRALLLNPNLAIAWFLGAFLQVFRGEPDVAIERFERAARLSPLDPDMFRIQAGVALAHLIAGRFDMASSWAEKSTRDWPDFTGAVGIVCSKPCACRAHGRSTGRRCGICVNSILRCAFPVSRIGCRSVARSISPCGRRA
jgi:tetratricopeptide (TPR) repeat protein